MNFDLYSYLTLVHERIHREQPHLVREYIKDYSCDICYPLYTTTPEFDNFWDWYSDSYY